MRAVLYSGGQESKNRRLHQALADLAGSRPRRTRKKLRFTYVAVWNDYSEMYFKRAQRRYEQFGFREFDCLRPDANPEPAAIRKAFQTDVIYLAGGNTFYFLAHLRRSRLIPRLREFSQKGGVLAGLSAGAIILTPSIELAAVPAYDADPNHVGLKDYKGIGLLPFEFYPHYRNSKKMRDAICLYSKRIGGRPVYASKDGDGILLDNDETVFFGNTQLFQGGRSFTLRS